MLKVVIAKKKHFEDYFNLRCEYENIKWTGYIKAPDKFELLSWYNNSIK